MQSPSGTAPQVDTPSGVSAPATGSGLSSDEGNGGRSATSQSQAPDSGGADRVAGREGSSGGSAQGPSVRSAVGDLWSAFEADKTSVLTPRGDDAVAADTGPGTGFGVGLALLGLGAAALLGGSVAFAGARRRRSVASSINNYDR